MDFEFGAVTSVHGLCAIEVPKPMAELVVKSNSELLGVDAVIASGS